MSRARSPVFIGSPQQRPPTKAFPSPWNSRRSSEKSICRITSDDPPRLRNITCRRRGGGFGGKGVAAGGDQVNGTGPIISDVAPASVRQIIGPVPFISAAGRFLLSVRAGRQAAQV